MKKPEENIVRFSSEEISKMKGDTDWERVDSITDEELEEMVKNDPDDVYLEDEEFGKGTFYRKGEWAQQFEEPKKKKQITLRLDEDVLAYFRGTGKGYQTRINNALRAFINARQESQS